MSDAAVQVPNRLRAVGPLLWKFTRSRWPVYTGVLVLLTLSRVASLTPPYASRFLIDQVIVAGRANLLMPLTVAIIGAGVLQSVFTLAATRLFAKEGVRLVMRLRCEVQEHLCRLPISFFDATASGALAKRVMDDASAGRVLFSPQVVDLLSGLLTGSLAVVALLHTSVDLTLFALASAAIFALLSKHTLKGLHPMHVENLRQAAALSGQLVEMFVGIRVIKSYHAESAASRMFAERAAHLHESVLRVLNKMASTQAITTTVMGVMMSALLYVAARRIFAGALTLGQLISFMALLSFFMSPVIQSAQLGPMLAEGLAGLERTRELLDEHREEDNSRRTHRLPTIRGRLVFDDVSFAYPPSVAHGPGVETLRHVSFTAEAGSATALVGSSGAGKSTVIGLVAAFYEPTAGQLTVDGVDLSTVRLDSFRTQLGIVLQDNVLFDGTIRDNVAMAGRNVTERAILEACRLAHVDEFAARLPDKYDTVVGERGIRLSVGQRQRIAIARAILADPRILILDEATSSLDSLSEAAIQDALTYLMAGRTTLIIAHRLSTIRNADQILVFEHGTISERGTHEALYARRGRYHELCLGQFSRGDVVADAVKGSVH